MTAFNIDTTAEQVTDALAEQVRGKNVIVTGCTKGGLGAESARAIAKHANLVILAGRSQSKLDETAKDIKEQFPSAKLKTLVLDLGSLAAVRKAAAEVNAYSEPINVLINNAAIMAVPYTLNTDGYESQFATNHFGHFLFTALIFPKIASSGSVASPSRIVNVSSSGHRFFLAKGEDPKTWISYFEDINFQDGKGYDKWLSYGRSKLANVLFSNEIAKRADEKKVPVLAYSLHPGGIITGLGTHLPKEEFKALGFMDENDNWTVHLKTLQAGAATQVVAAFDPSIAGLNGAYLEDGDLNTPSLAGDRTSKDVQVLQGQLWEFTEKTVGVNFPL